MTNEELEKLFAKCDYQPEEIGVAILQKCGYKISGTTVDRNIHLYKIHSKDGKKLLYSY